MVLHPEIQEKGRAEIYRVIGTDRLPAIVEYDPPSTRLLLHLDDLTISRENLPYLEAILKEVLRWHPIVPTVSYRSLEEFKYRGTESCSAHRTPLMTSGRLDNSQGNLLLL